eukprot:scaffold47875_cov34-Tisochrysis_lutea.AAC.1
MQRSALRYRACSSPYLRKAKTATGSSGQTSMGTVAQATTVVSGSTTQSPVREMKACIAIRSASDPVSAAVSPST